MSAVGKANCFDCGDLRGFFDIFDIAHLVFSHSVCFFLTFLNVVYLLAFFSSRYKYMFANSRCRQIHALMIFLVTFTWC